MNFSRKVFFATFLSALIGGTVPSFARLDDAEKAREMSEKEAESVYQRTPTEYPSRPKKEDIRQFPKTIEQIQERTEDQVDEERIRNLRKQAE